jgi:hypothetical protein
MSQAARNRRRRCAPWARAYGNTLRERTSPAVGGARATVSSARLHAADRRGFVGIKSIGLRPARSRRQFLKFIGSRGRSTGCAALDLSGTLVSLSCVDGALYLRGVARVGVFDPGDQMAFERMAEDKFAQIMGRVLSPSRAIESVELLKGRMTSFAR